MSDPNRTWQVLIQRRAEKEMRRLDKPLRQRLRLAIRQLGNDPVHLAAKNWSDRTICTVYESEIGVSPMPSKMKN